MVERYGCAAARRRLRWFACVCSFWTDLPFQQHSATEAALCGANSLGTLQPTGWVVALPASIQPLMPAPSTATFVWPAVIARLAAVWLAVHFSFAQ